MPKLTQAMAQEADKAADDGGPAPIPAGVYVGKLLGVTVSDKEGDSGYHYWMWEYQVMDEGYTSKKLRLITSLSPKARFSIGGAFAAHGVPSDTHTDELVGSRVLLQVTQGPIQKGPRAGQVVNRLDYTMPYDEDQAQGINPNHDEDF